MIEEIETPKLYNSLMVGSYHFLTLHNRISPKQEDAYREILKPAKIHA
jgi:hypothetical protein